MLYSGAVLLWISNSLLVFQLQGHERQLRDFSAFYLQGTVTQMVFWGGKKKITSQNIQYTWIKLTQWEIWGQVTTQRETGDPKTSRPLPRSVRCSEGLPRPVVLFQRERVREASVRWMCRPPHANMALLPWLCSLCGFSVRNVSA